MYKQTQNPLGKREAKELIKRRRLQMIVHSFLYYHLDDPIWTDHQWQEAADELTELQKEHGYKFKFYDRYFADWDGSSGAFLPLKEDWVYFKAKQLLKYHEKLLTE